MEVALVSTFWSIAQKNNRETEASGMGWELFKNYLIAKKKFNPDFFLYENNKSASQAIKDQISHELGVDLMHINSALVSAQTRERFYAFNWVVDMPKDRGIILRDILEPSHREICYELQTVGVGWRGRKESDGKYHKRFESANEPKANALTTVPTDSMVAEPIRIGDIGSIAQAHRVYSCDGKSRVLIANAGGQGGKTGLYLVPVSNMGHKGGHIYLVRSGQLEVAGKMYPVKIPDGLYCIRKLTPIECERLQTLPDGYTKAVSNAQRYKCLGNGWTAEVIVHILNGALKDVPRDEEIVVLSMYDGIATGRYCLDKMGFTNVKYFAYEIDKYAKQVALSNYPDIIHLGDAFDIRHPDWTVGY